MTTNAQPLDLALHPASVIVTGLQTVAVIQEVKQRGGRVLGMAQAGQNGVWSLRIDWPQATLFSPVWRQGAVNQDAL